MLKRIDHIGVAVQEIEPAIELWGGRMQLQLVHRETVREQGVEAALLEVGEGHLELLCPLSPDTPVGRFLASRGPGLHHVAYQVQDIDAVLAALASAGMPLIDSSPRTGIRGSKVAFLHPAGTGGVLTEIVQRSCEHFADRTRLALAHVDEGDARGDAGGDFAHRADEPLGGLA